MILGHDLGAWKRKKNYRQMSRNVNKDWSLFIAWGGPAAGKLLGGITGFLGEQNSGGDQS